jgi:molecular chaperone IbpA
MRTSIWSPMGYRPLPSVVDEALGMFERGLGGSAQPETWPAYDLFTLDEDRYRIVLAVPGFKETDLEIVSEPNRLTVAGRPGDRPAEGQAVFRSIAVQPFRRIYQLADHVRVETARLQDGLLTLDLVRELPEAMKPRRIQISSDPAAIGPAGGESRQTH